MIETTSCSVLNRDNQLIGTAPHQSIYVMVDCPKPWAAKVQGSSTFPAAARAALEVAYKHRLSFGLLARTPTGEVPAMTLFRFFNGTVSEVSLDLDRPDLGDALVRACAEGSGRPVARSLWICTHGSRDRCCATLGVPLLKAARAMGGRPVVEVSHLGGHRFAPTCLAVPEWRTFGRLTPERVGDFLGSLEAGDLVQQEWLRGHNALGLAAQVVELAWAREEGRMPIASLPLSGEEDSLTGIRALFPGTEGEGWRERWAQVGFTTWTGPVSCIDIGSQSEAQETKSYRWECWANPPTAACPGQTVAPP